MMWILILTLGVSGHVLEGFNSQAACERTVAEIERTYWHRSTEHVTEGQFGNLPVILEGPTKPSLDATCSQVFTNISSTGAPN